MGIVAICSLISDVNVNEEPHPQIPEMVIHVGSHSEERSTKLSVVSAPFLGGNQKGARSLFTVRLLDHRFTKCCLFWLLNTVGV